MLQQDYIRNNLKTIKWDIIRDRREKMLQHKTQVIESKYQAERWLHLALAFGVLKMYEIKLTQKTWFKLHQQRLVQILDA